MQSSAIRAILRAARSQPVYCNLCRTAAPPLRAEARFSSTYALSPSTAASTSSGPIYVSRRFQSQTAALNKDPEPAVNLQPVEEHDIVIVGGGLVGLALANALGTKLLKSLLYEQNDAEYTLVIYGSFEHNRSGLEVQDLATGSERSGQSSELVPSSR